MAVAGFLDRTRIVAPAGWSRWLIPPAALSIHLAIGQAYAWSVFEAPLAATVLKGDPNAGTLSAIAIMCRVARVGGGARSAADTVHVMSAMSEWVTQVCRELGLELADPDATTTRVLDLTAEVAHGVARPAAPVTAFLVGLAAGGTRYPDETVEQLCRSLGDRARAWSDTHPE